MSLEGSNNNRNKENITFHFSQCSLGKYLLLRPKLWSVWLYDQPFSRYKLVENENALNDFRMNDLKHIYGISTLHTLRTCNQGSTFGPFRATAIHSRRTKKIGNALNDLRVTLNI